MNADNPLLDFSDLPRFDLVQPEQVKPAIESLLSAGRELIERLTAETTPATWRDFAGALADGLEPFGRAWGIVGHLHSVNDVPAWREAYNQMLPEVSRFYAELGQNLKLFEKYKALRDSSEYAALTREQKKVIDNEIRDFRLSGAELPEEQKPRFQAISEELSQLSAKFSENLLDATNAFAEIVTARDGTPLEALPQVLWRMVSTQMASRSTATTRPVSTSISTLLPDRVGYHAGGVERHFPDNRDQYRNTGHVHAAGIGDSAAAADHPLSRSDILAQYLQEY